MIGAVNTCGAEPTDSTVTRSVLPMFCWFPVSEPFQTFPWPVYCPNHAPSKSSHALYSFWRSNVIDVMPFRYEWS